MPVDLRCFGGDQGAMHRLQRVDIVKDRQRNDLVALCAQPLYYLVEPFLRGGVSPPQVRFARRSKNGLRRRTGACQSAQNSTRAMPAALRVKKPAWSGEASGMMPSLETRCSWVCSRPRHRTGGADDQTDGLRAQGSGQSRQPRRPPTLLEPPGVCAGLCGLRVGPGAK